MTSSALLIALCAASLLSSATCAALAFLVCRLSRAPAAPLASSGAESPIVAAPPSSWPPLDPAAPDRVRDDRLPGALSAVLTPSPSSARAAPFVLVPPPSPRLSDLAHGRSAQ